MHPKNWIVLSAVMITGMAVICQAQACCDNCTDLGSVPASGSGSGPTWVLRIADLPYGYDLTLIAVASTDDSSFEAYVTNDEGLAANSWTTESSTAHIVCFEQTTNYQSTTRGLWIGIRCNNYFLDCPLKYKFLVNEHSAPVAPTPSPHNPNPPVSIPTTDIQPSVPPTSMSTMIAPQLLLCAIVIFALIFQ